MPLSVLASYAFICMGTVVAGIGTTLFPFGGDQGNYAYAAWAWVEGQVPYRDVLVFKPPLTLLFYRAAHLLWPHSMAGIRWIDLAWQLGTVVLLAGFTYFWTKDRIAAITAAVIYILCYYQFDYWHTAQTEGWISLPVLLALVATTIAIRRDEWRLMILAGVAIGFAGGLKYTGLLGAFPLVILVALQAPRQAWRRIGFAFLSGVIAVAAVTIMWLMRIGAWEAFVAHHLVTLPNYAGFSPYGRDVAGVSAMIGLLFHIPQLRVLGWAFLLGLLGMIVWLIGQRMSGRDRDARWTFRVVVLTLLAAAIAATFSQGKFFSYHYLPWIAPVALMGGCISHDLAATTRTHFRSAMLAVAGVSLYLSTATAQNTGDWLGVVTGRQAIEEHWASGQFVRADHVATDSFVLAQWLRRHTTADDAVFIWGRHPEVNYVARRRIPTRFIHNYDFRFPWAGAGLLSELLRDLNRTRPEIIAIASGDRTFGASGNPKDSREVLATLEPLEEWIGAHYEPVTKIGIFEVLRRTQELGHMPHHRPGERQ
jgi:hypothetical protein